MASWFIRDNILKARDEGMGVMLLSGDLEEEGGQAETMLYGLSSYEPGSIDAMDGEDRAGTKGSREGTGGHSHRLYGCAGRPEEG